MPQANLSELASNVAIVFIFLIFLWKVGAKFLTSLDKNTKSNQLTADAMKSLVSETRKGNREAEKRNGHLGEQNVQIAELIAEHTKTITKELKKLEKQTVKQQTVEHQTVENKE